MASDSARQDLHHVSPFANRGLLAHGNRHQKAGVLRAGKRYRRNERSGTLNLPNTLQRTLIPRTRHALRRAEDRLEVVEFMALKKRFTTPRRTRPQGVVRDSNPATSRPQTQSLLERLVFEQGLHF